MADYIESEDQKFAIQIIGFNEKLPDYKTTFDLSVSDLDEVDKDAKFVRFVILGKVATDKFGQDWTKIKDQVRYGTGGEVLTPFPTPPDTSTPPTAVAPGVEGRFRALVKRLKAHKNYTLGIGEALGIEAPHTPFVPENGKPKLTGKLANGGHPLLHAPIGKYEAIEIWKDSGTGYAKLDRAQHPDYLDLSPLPAAGVSAVWHYKAIYIYQGAQVGDWSGDVKITVVGNV